MKSISMTAWCRASYSELALDSITKARGYMPWRFFASVDGPIHPDQDTVLGHQCAEVRAVFERRHMGHPDVRFHRNNMGCNANIFQAVQMAFDAGSDFNLHVEDDIVLSPDALELSNWFYNLPERDEYVCLNVFSDWRDHGNQPLAIAEYFSFFPWGWACTRRMWEKYLAPEWDTKRFGPTGWDWSVGMTIQKHGLKVLRPFLSRALNIGRDQGLHMSSDHWEKNFSNQVVSDGSHGKDYYIARPLPADYAQHPDQWYLDELKAEQEAIR
jgi:hypothetical protein